MHKNFWSQLFAGVCLIFLLLILIPVGLFFFIFKFVTMPSNYCKYKRSQYQKDFPHKFNFLDPFHVDSIPYSIVKENQLPIEYIKWGEEYETHGYFTYKDILLDFTEPFFFDPETNRFMFDSEEVEEKTENDNDRDIDDAGHCLSVGETKAFVLDEFHERIQERECKQVVFLYAQERLEKAYGKTAVEKMSEVNDFLVYQKGTLFRVLKEFVDTH